MQKRALVFLIAILFLLRAVTFSYQRGGASLLDFMNAQNDYRSIQRSYLNLIGSYLTAGAQLNLAVGREVIP